ncbi:helix-turn-helix domain-containing protein [Mucilaginibacter terrae]|uniref:AraC family transcriptional regulator n=1 Tax=Mucilaginibacter terrae TaxID=1955052 RepID=A0ABU3GN24_9SPHI|nr:AraC family transcriptional regulator [Mucilaginibacter terrae]MDT3401169.1 AraC family transcriptional regulator [Mucilaginibacter terrae]
MIKRILRHTFSLLNTDHVKLSAKWNYRNVISPYHRIYYIDDGLGEISDMENKLKLEPGYLYIIPSFTLCNLTCQDYLSQYFVQFFEESSDGVSLFANNRSVFKVKAQEIDVINFQRLVVINPGRGINRSDNPKVYEKNIYYREYQELNNQQNIAAFLETQGLLLQLVSRFATPTIFRQKEVKYIPVKILESISFISVNLHISLSVAFLAKRVNLNPEYFSRLFQEYTGTRPLLYVQEKRIERAQYLIVTSQTSYSEIAEQTGFESLSHFSRTFKSVTGITPSAFKRQIYSTKTD